MVVHAELYVEKALFNHPFWLSYYFLLSCFRLCV